MTAGITYYFRLEGADLESNTRFSQSVSGIPLDSPSEVSTLLQTGATSASVTCGIVQGASGYRVDYETSAGLHPGFEVSSQNTLAVTALQTGAQMRFACSATNASGALKGSVSTINLIESVALNPLSFTSPMQLIAAWSGGAGASQFEVYYGTVSGTLPTLAPSCSVSPCLITGLTEGVPYFVEVRAGNSSGGSMKSQERSGVPLQRPVLTLTPGATSLAASWTSAGLSATYTLKYGTVAGNYPSIVSSAATSPLSKIGEKLPRSRGRCKPFSCT